MSSNLLFKKSHKCSLFVIYHLKNGVGGNRPFLKKNRFFYTELIKDSGAWIGLSKPEDSYDSWQWSDHSKVNFTSWFKGQPNNRDGNENCVFVSNYSLRIQTYFKDYLYFNKFGGL